MDKKGYSYLGISILAFSTLEIVAKFIVNDFHPLQMNFLRFFIAGLAILPIAMLDMKKREIKMSYKEIITIILLGILSIPVSSSFYQLSLYYTKASILAVLISSNAIFVAPFSYFILKEKLDKAVIISLVLGVSGMLIIANPSSSMGSNDFIGILYGIANSITFALYSVFGKKLVPKLGGLVLNCLVFLAGSLALLPVMLYAKIPVIAGINGSNIFHILYIAIVVNAVGYIFMFKGLSILPANKGSLVFFVKPGLAGILAYFILKETFSLNLIIGTLFIISGILFIVVSGNRKASPGKVNLSTELIK